MIWVWEMEFRSTDSMTGLVTGVMESLVEGEAGENSTDISRSTYVPRVCVCVCARLWSVVLCCCSLLLFLICVVLCCVVCLFVCLFRFVSFVCVAALRCAACWWCVGTGEKGDTKTQSVRKEDTEHRTHNTIHT